MVNRTQYHIFILAYIVLITFFADIQQGNAFIGTSGASNIVNKFTTTLNPLSGAGLTDISVVVIDTSVSSFKANPDINKDNNELTLYADLKIRIAYDAKTNADISKFKINGVSDETLAYPYVEFRDIHTGVDSIYWISFVNQKLQPYSIELNGLKLGISYVNPPKSGNLLGQSYTINSEVYYNAMDFVEPQTLVIPTKNWGGGLIVPSQYWVGGYYHYEDTWESGKYNVNFDKITNENHLQILENTNYFYRSAFGQLTEENKYVVEIQPGKAIPATNVDTWGQKNVVNVNVPFLLSPKITQQREKLSYLMLSQVVNYDSSHSPLPSISEPVTWKYLDRNLCMEVTNYDISQVVIVTTRIVAHMKFSSEISTEISESPNLSDYIWDKVIGTNKVSNLKALPPTDNTMLYILILIGVAVVAVGAIVLIRKRASKIVR